MRLYANHFQPSFKLLDKSRNGGTVRKRYEKPATPCDRLLRRDDVSEEAKQRLRNSRAELDPVSLPHTEPSRSLNCPLHVKIQVWSAS